MIENQYLEDLSNQQYDHLEQIEKYQQIRDQFSVNYPSLRNP